MSVQGAPRPPSQTPPAPPGGSSGRRSLSDRLRAIDDYQQRHGRLSFVVAVYKKFNDDQGGSLAALIAYYGFVSIFPLLLVFVTVLGFVIHGNQAEQQRVLDSALGQIPLLKVPLSANSLTGSPAALAIGLIGSLLAGMAITNATSRAFSVIWQIPRTERPNFFKTRARGIGLLVVLGALNLLSSAAAGFATSATRGTAADIAGILVAFLANIALFLSAYVFLTAAKVAVRDLMPGVLIGAIGWQIVQHLGGYWAGRVAHQEALYGEFGLVLGLLAILYIGAQILVLAAEVNVVRTRGLWPRSMLAPPPAAQRI